jgi:hypothetical protein
MSDATIVPIPNQMIRDEPPLIDGMTLPFNEEFPDSTPEAPYGFFPDGRPRKRKPRASSAGATATGSRRMPVSESDARAAANLLAMYNKLAGATLSLYLPVTAAVLDANNDDFAEQAYQSLLTDPALCKSILSSGGVSGKLGLAMAYAILVGTIAPGAMIELRVKRNNRNNSDEKVTTDEQVR